MKMNPIHLNDAHKTYQHDQDKVITPETTIARFKQRLAESGLHILEDIVRIDNGRLGIPVYFSVCGDEAREIIGKNKQMGKGATPLQSQASAVMELGERFSLFSFMRSGDNFMTAPRSALREPAMSRDQIACSVSDQSEDLPIALDIFDTLPLKWTWSYNLTQDRSVLVPFDWFWTINEFNGSSAGNCAEEAICQGICEVVERHVSALVSRNRLKVPCIAEDSIKDPVALELLSRYKTAGIELCLSDFTLEMGIPSIGALAWDPGTFPEKSEIVWTAGTTPNPAKALCRALTEVAQLAGDFNSSGNYVASGLPKFNALAQADYVIQPGHDIELQKLPDLSDNNIKIEVQRLVDALSKKGMQVHVIDVHHPKLKIPAFYTIIPGALFRERAAQPSVAMICAKMIYENFAPASARQALLEMEKKLPNKYYIHFYLSQIDLNTGNYRAAIARLNRAVELGPESEDLASIYTYLGVCHKEMGDFGEALAALNHADRIDSERTDTLNLMGVCHYKLSAFAEAIASFKRVVALNPSSAIDYANLGVNYRAIGDNAKAVEYFQLALSLDPHIEFAQSHLAELGGAPK